MTDGDTPTGGTLIADQSAIALLRGLLPDRCLTWAEAHAVTERQAGLLLDLLHVAEPPVPQFVISSLPGIMVDWQDGWPTSGMALQARSHWRIVLDKTEPRQRQRFTLAHEFKHVLDDPLIDRIHAHLQADDQAKRAEHLCNYFAACLLMPRPWVKHDWYGGLQRVGLLARRYYVSRAAMTRRLSELGLTSTPLLAATRQQSNGTGEVRR